MRLFFLSFFLPVVKYTQHKIDHLSIFSAQVSGIKSIHLLCSHHHHASPYSFFLPETWGSTGPNSPPPPTAPDNHHPAFCLYRFAYSANLINTENAISFLWLFYFTERNVFKAHPGCSMCLNFPPFKIIFKKELSSLFTRVIVCGMYTQNFSSLIFLSSTLWLLWWEQPGREWPRPVPWGLSAWRGSPVLCRPGGDPLCSVSLEGIPCALPPGAHLHQQLWWLWSSRVTCSVWSSLLTPTDPIKRDKDRQVGRCSHPGVLLFWHWGQVEPNFTITDSLGSADGVVSLLPLDWGLAESSPWSESAAPMVALPWACVIEPRMVWHLLGILSRGPSWHLDAVPLD